MDIRIEDQTYYNNINQRLAGLFLRDRFPEAIAWPQRA